MGHSLPAIILGAALFLTCVSAASPALAQTGAAEEELQTSYSLDAPGVTKPVTMKVEHHVYHPGDEVRVEGSVWPEIVDGVDAPKIVKLELKDGQGNTVGRQDAGVAESDGKFAGSLGLLDTADQGTYTLEARVELEADALGIVKTLTSAALQSSAQFAVSEQDDYSVSAEGEDFAVGIASNSGLDNFEFDQQEKKVSFTVEGDSGTAGFAEVTVPKRLLSGEMKVFIDRNLVPGEDVLLKSSTETETALEINYQHSVHTVEVVGTNVIPEFPAAAGVAAAAIAAAISVTTVMAKRSAFKAWRP